MQSISVEIKNCLDDPKTLERLYRQNPMEFSRQLDLLYSQNPDSMVLQVWWQRLHFQEEKSGSSAIREKSFEWALIIILALISGTFANIPEFFDGIKESSFYPRNIAFIFLPSLSIYFLLRKRTGRWQPWLIAVVFFISLIYINLLPSLNHSDSIVIACIHLPFLLWAMTGLAFAGNGYGDASLRLGYVRFNGELLIHTTIILLGGVVLTGITIGLFSVIQIDIFDWYLRYVVIYGVAAAPLVGVYVISHFTEDKIKIAPIVGRIFSPLFLITFIVYLAAMIASGKSPYADREFLLVFNFMLIIVLGLLIFVLSERPPAVRQKSDWLYLSLLLIVLILDAVALSAIAFRLSSYGLTPNRSVVLGANLLIFIHLAGMLVNYLKMLFGRGEAQQLERWMGNYLTVYAVWVVWVVYGWPVLFSFK